MSRETRSTAVCSRQTDFEVGITCFCRILSTVFGREFNSFNQQFEKILHKLSYFESEIYSVVCGDFSINLLKNDSKRAEFENIFFGNCFTPSISLASHEKPGCDPSCIDNIFVSLIVTFLGSGILNETRVSHHYPTVCFYDLCIENKNNDNKTTLPHYDYCESNINEFNSKLVQKLSVESFSHDETDFCKFTQCIQNAIDECFLVEPEIFY